MLLIYIKINRELRDFSEKVFFGLSLRQFTCTLASMAAAAGLYYFLKPHLGTELVSWVCVLGAAPFVFLGFVRYNGMPAERLAAAWFRSVILTPGILRFRSRNFYGELLQPKTKNAKRMKENSAYE